ncbi:MAG: hypothetical protein HYS12_29900 [Planctomycetes bacterium]|nr:hypothetical protein [Planctomycetota bacterium]
MTPNAKLRDIATKLLQRTQLNEVEWKRSFLEGDEEVLHVVFPKSQIRLLFRSPATEPDFVVMEVWNERKALIAHLKAEEGDDDWELLSGLYSEALRSATKWDEVLSDVERAIAKPGKIGEP